MFSRIVFERAPHRNVGGGLLIYGEKATFGPGFCPVAAKKIPLWTDIRIDAGSSGRGLHSVTGPRGRHRANGSGGAAMTLFLPPR
jgi:hypothetical protein